MSTSRLFLLVTAFHRVLAARPEHPLPVRGLRRPTGILARSGRARSHDCRRGRRGPVPLPAAATAAGAAGESRGRRPHDLAEGDCGGSRGRSLCPRCAGGAHRIAPARGLDSSNRRPIDETVLREWSAEPGITWHGATDNAPCVWREHHVALFLSYYREGLPRTLVEVAAAGRPIVTTNVTGCRDVVRDGVEWILVPPGDIDAWARRQTGVFTSASRRRRSSVLSVGSTVC